MIGFSIFPHLDNPICPENTMADAEKWASNIPGPSYAIDDQTAIAVGDGEPQVVSEGHWRLFDRQGHPRRPRGRRPQPDS
jgi:dipeptidase E